MTIYWLMFAWPAAASFLTGINKGSRGNNLIWFFFALVYVILIGLRTETGGDWTEYHDMTEMISFQSLGSALSITEPGFALLTWVSGQLGWDVYGTTTVCAIILVYALIRFSRRQPDSWLAVTASVPYLVIVIGMGYVRQAAAIGFIMLALLDFETGRRVRCILYIILATLFHTSSLVISPLLAIIYFRKNVLYLVPIALGSIPAFLYLLNSRMDVMMTGYINQEYSSSGTLVRLFMNAVPSTIFLVYRKRFPLNNNMRLLWTTFAVLSYFLFIGYAASPSSTVVDRLGLYLIPIQVMVAGNLPLVLAGRTSDTRMINIIGIFYFGLVEFVWLNFADNAFLWLPYKSLLTT